MLKPIIKPVLAATTDLNTVVKESGFFKFTNIGQMVSRVFSVSLSISGVLVFMFLVWGAIDLISSQGDKQQLEGARNKITYALIGLGIMVVAWAAWILVLKFFGIGETVDGTVIFKSPDSTSTGVGST